MVIVGLVPGTAGLSQAGTTQGQARRRDLKHPVSTSQARAGASGGELCGARSPSNAQHPGPAASRAALFSLSSFPLLPSGVTQARKLGDVSVHFHVRTLSMCSQLRAARCSPPRDAGAPKSLRIPGAARPLGIPGAAGSGDIPSEMGRLCSGRPEKSQGQRGEVMVAASGVILLPHLRGPLSDSAAPCGCGGAGNTHLLLCAAPFLPCPALLQGMQP